MSYERDIQRLHSRLDLKQPLVGCHRRNIGTRNEPNKYSLIKGNAILQALGAQKFSVTTPVGQSEHMRLGDSLITFRAGPWQTYWAEDLAQELAVVRSYTNLKGITDTGLIAWENRGELQIQDIDLSQFSITGPELVEQYNSNGRISKNTKRALRICPNCPIKARCDATDVTLGQTLDWHAKYPKD